MQATTLYDRELERFVVQTRRETNKLAGTDRVFEVASLSRSEVAADIQLIASGAQELRRQALGAGAASNGRKGLERAKSGQTRRYGQAAEPNKPNSEKNKPKTIKVMDTQMTEIKVRARAKPAALGARRRSRWAGGAGRGKGRGKDRARSLNAHLPTPSPSHCAPCVTFAPSSAPPHPPPFPPSPLVRPRSATCPPRRRRAN